MREPVDVALRHVGGVPAVEDVGAHVAPVLLVDALAAGRAVAAVECRKELPTVHVQCDTSGRQHPPVDSVTAVLAAGRLLLYLPAA